MFDKQLKNKESVQWFFGLSAVIGGFCATMETDDVPEDVRASDNGENYEAGDR